MKLFLIGFMGCGKSSLGRMLARKLNLPFCDMDREIVAREGLDVNAIFSRYGEQYFRNCERSLLNEIEQTQGDMIIATGGGVALSVENRMIMDRCGVTFYIKRSPEQLFKRLSYGKFKRPLVAAKNDDELKSYINHTLEQREPCYRLAKMTVDGRSMSDPEMVELIIMTLKYGVC